jgi:hypothetical protein
MFLTTTSYTRVSGTYEVGIQAKHYQAFFSFSFQTKEIDEAQSWNLTNTLCYL